MILAIALHLMLIQGSLEALSRLYKGSPIRLTQGSIGGVLALALRLRLIQGSIKACLRLY
jgi:hypothetical protein